jgi:hypothetical protein
MQDLAGAADYFQVTELKKLCSDQLQGLVGGFLKNF